MLTELCSEVNNYFDRDMPKIKGTFTISGKVLVGAVSYGLQVGQYFRIIGSVCSSTQAEQMKVSLMRSSQALFGY